MFERIGKVIKCANRNSKASGRVNIPTEMLEFLGIDVETEDRNILISLDPTSKKIIIEKIEKGGVNE
ncbi:MAG: hypothetical protein ACRDBY_05960 [Cetobacterium sp.]